MLKDQYDAAASFELPPLPSSYDDPQLSPGFGLVPSLPNSRGRPKSKKRGRGLLERLSRKQRKQNKKGNYTCSLCGKPGHSARLCKNGRP